MEFEKVGLQGLFERSGGCDVAKRCWKRVPLLGGQRVKKHVPQKSLFEPVEQRGCGGRRMCVGFVQECK